MANLISVSSAPVAMLGDKEYYDLVGTVEVLKRILRESVVDGVELQLEPEWDRENPPLSDAHLADWTKTPKYSILEILDFLKKEKLPILSVHASRDIGNYLCSHRKQDIEKGKRLTHDTLSLANELESKICVFHLWDTWKTEFDIERLKEILSDIAVQFPRLKASVENIPTRLNECTPFPLTRFFDYVTLDLRWAALYDELDAFESTIDNVVNVHLRGRLEKARWVLDRSPFAFYEALDKIRKGWKYAGPLTVEPEGQIDESRFEDFLKAMRSLRT